MQYRKLGRTGIQVSCVGFGGIPLAGLNQEEASAVLNAALDGGLNFIDTARGYRESEELIGSAVSCRRDEYFLATKARARDEKRIREELETSLRNLRTDRIDLYQIHYVNTARELEAVMTPGGALEVMQKIKDQGLADHIGITGHNADVLLEAAKTGAFDTVQGAFSYVEKDPQVVELIDWCAERDIGFIAQKPLAGGALTCAPAGLKWILQHPVSTVIPGMSSVEQVTQNLAVADGDCRLSREEQEELERIAASLEGNFCRRCYYCHSACPQNIRIGVILEFYGKARIPENLALAKECYRGISIDASDCTECGQCLDACPYGLPIMDLLREAHALLA